MSFAIRENCRFCNSKLEIILHLGDNFPLAGAFLKNLSQKEEYYPLTLGYCRICYLMQCIQVINSDTLFKNEYFYYSSMVPFLVKHFNSFANDLALRFCPEKTFIIEIGSNDGVFSNRLKIKGLMY